MSLRNDIKMFEYYSKITKHCPNCGHSITMPKFVKKTICNWCGLSVYQNKQEEFKDILKKKIIKENKK